MVGISFVRAGLAARAKPSVPHSDDTVMAGLLSSLSSLEKLNIQDCFFDSADIIIVFPSFPRLPLLYHLHLCGPFLDDSVVLPLITALLQVPDLRTLSLRDGFCSCHFLFSEAHQFLLRLALLSNFLVFLSLFPMLTLPIIFSISYIADFLSALSLSDFTTESSCRHSISHRHCLRHVFINHCD